MTMKTADKLKRIMEERYTINNVCSEHRETFEANIKGRLDVIDANIEKFNDPEQQRDLSVKFAWGHNHDFGSFSLRGRMEDRHINIIAEFVDEFGMPIDLSNKNILDIGVWTGGTSLLLCAMGANVTALEEVVKYSDTVNYLAEAFALPGLVCRPISLYALDDQDLYDYVLYSGVIYHVTDPVLSLRIAFNSLKDGGKIFVETKGVDAGSNAPPLAIVEGASVVNSGSKGQLNRGGWNYFIPSPSGLHTWMDSTGFDQIRVSDVDSEGRITGVGTRTRHKDMLRAGLSRADIR